MSTKQKSKMLVLDVDELDSRTSAFMDFFRSRMIGQPNAEQMAQMMFERMLNRLRNKRRPIAVIGAIGPSRTGKSYSGHLIAEYLHGDPEALVELEAADFTEKHQVLELRGAPPSYVGSLDKKEKAELKPEDVDPRSAISGHNLKRVRLNSKSDVSVVVINEFEKAHRDFYKFWMGVFDKGYAKLGDGEIVDFRNTIFILTMNLGMDEVEKLEDGGIGFNRREHKATADEVAAVVKKAMKENYKREFRNRLDAVCVFKPHTAGDLLNIVGSELRLVETRMDSQLERGEMFELVVDDDARQLLLDKAMADGGSVAELSRVIEAEIVNMLGRVLSTHQVGGTDRVVVFVDEVDGARKLRFGLVEGEGAVADVDRMAAVAGGYAKGGTREALDWQRQLARAERLQHKPDVKIQVFSITIKGGSENDLLVAGMELRHDLQKVYKVKKLGSIHFNMEPLFAVLTVETTDDMVLAIQAKYPDAEIQQVRRGKSS